MAYFIEPFTGEFAVPRTPAVEPLVAHVYGETPPDFAALAACGFEIACVDMNAPWYHPGLALDGNRHGVRVVAFAMSYRAGDEE